MAFVMDCAPYYSADGSGLVGPPLVNGFYDGFCAVLLSGWLRIAHSSTRQWLSRWFLHLFALPIAVDCSFFHSSTAFTMVYTLYFLVDGSELRILSLVNSFHDGFRAVLLRRWQRITHSSARRWLSRRFACCIAQWLAADCSFLHSSTAFMTVCSPYFSVDGGGLLIVSLINGFHDGFRTVLLYRWQQIAHSSARRRLS